VATAVHRDNVFELIQLLPHHPATMVVFTRRRVFRRDVVASSMVQIAVTRDAAPIALLDSGRGPRSSHFCIRGVGVER
jgi:hypothetical protein